MCRWNQLDLVIVLLSIMGITLEKIEEASLPINPTIIRIMRVLRIARGMNPSPVLLLFHLYFVTLGHRHTGTLVSLTRLVSGFQGACKTTTALGLPSLSFLHGRSQHGVSRPDGKEKCSTEREQERNKDCEGKEVRKDS